MIKKVWVTKDEHTSNICIRFNGYDEHVPQLVANKTGLPPNEGRMSHDTALKQGKLEEHWVIGVFLHDDLVKVRNAINEAL